MSIFGNNQTQPQNNIFSNQQQPLYGQPNTMGQQQGQYNYGNQQQNNNNLNQQQQQQQQMHLQSLSSTLQTLYSIQNQTELQYTLQFLQAQQTLADQQLSKSIDKTGINILPEGEMANIKEKCTRMKKRNQQLMIKLLNVKEHLTRLMYSDVTTNSKSEHQSRQMEDTIRGLKGNIANKFHFLKTNQGIKSTVVKPREQIQMANSLTQIKKGTEVMERQVIKDKAEMELVVKYLQDRQ